MKALSKIAILIGFIVSISSCQKEDNLSPDGGCPSHNNSATHRASDSEGTKDDNSEHSAVKGERGEEIIDGEVIGGGDDDRDGGGKKIRKN